jgi:hypothetical protein
MPVVLVAVVLLLSIVLLLCGGGLLPLLPLSVLPNHRKRRRKHWQAAVAVRVMGDAAGCCMG